MRILPYFLPLIAVSIACNRSEPPTGRSSSSAPFAEVKVSSPRKKALTREIEQPGTIVAEEEAALFAKLSGYVTKYHALIGQRVESGALLADIAIPELTDEARQKRALKLQAEKEVTQARQLFEIAKENVKAMDALADESRAGLKRADANYKRWESESLRVSKLVESRTLEPQIGAETINQFLAAEAARDEAKARVATADARARRTVVEKDKAEGDIEVARAKLEVAEAEAQRLDDLVKYTKIRAPFDGVVTYRGVSEGSFVQPAGSPDAKPLFVVMKIDTVRVVVNVPEADAPLVHQGDKVQIVISAQKGVPINGKVSRTADALDPVSRTLRTEIDLPNADRMLKPGTFASTRIRSKLSEQWVLPAGAVAMSGDQMVCFRVEGDKAVRLPVQIGRSDGKSGQVLKKWNASTDTWENWTGSEMIVESNAAYLTDGQTVTVSTERDAAKK